MAQKKMKFWQKAAVVIGAIGNINWGLVALGYNAVDALVGAGSTLAMIIYGLVGITGIYSLYWLFFGSK